MSKGPLDSILDPFKDLVWDTLVEKAIQAHLTTSIGPLAAGIFGKFLTWLFTRFSDALYIKMSELANLQAIAFKNDAAQEAYDRASVKLQILFDQAGPDSKEFKDARIENKKKLKGLVQFDVARSG